LAGAAVSRIFDPAVGGGDHSCPACRITYAIPFVHPTLGPVCPACLTAVPRRKHKPRRRATADEPKGEDRRFRADHPGTPLGKGYPSGSTLRMDGESHRQAWMRLLRADPCAYCGALPSGTVDHIVAKSEPSRVLYGRNSWLNLTGCCPACNTNKATRSLLTFLHKRAANRPSGRANIVRSTKATREELAA
jgi:5-methylcytosine-specific restriction endonuclease McrA